jgi:heptosyltransferase-1
MKVLVVKTSSLGDMVHTLPALTDAMQAIPGIRFDWVVEEAFAEIPAWHPAVNNVIPVALRRWRRHPLNALRNGEWHAFRGQLQAARYDRIIDAQGLLKSAVLTVMAYGMRCGLSWTSLREPLAVLAYQQRVRVVREQHAITRVRQLFAEVLGYSYHHAIPDYGLNRASFKSTSNPDFANAASRLPQLPKLSAISMPYIVLLHGTAWSTKQWPEADWITLGRLATQAGYTVYLPWGNAEERRRAARIAGSFSRAEVLPQMDLYTIAAFLSAAAGVVSVDTGLSHLAAALDVPAVTLYGATDPALTGAWGKRQTHLKAVFPCAPCLRRICRYRGPVTVPQPPCYGTLPAVTVWDALRSSMRENTVTQRVLEHR